jgi:YfiH family protein
MTAAHAWITPEWPAPGTVHAAATLRTGGVSKGPFASLNLGSHVGDEPAAVDENRRRVRAMLRLPSAPAWLNQVHGTRVVEAHQHATPPTADAAFARNSRQVCVVLTADCLPVLLCDREGTRVAAAHAGWRGLADGVLRASVEALDTPAQRLMAWLGPAIEQDAFEVGAEVRDRFITTDAANATAFRANERGRWQADLYDLARRELARLGVDAVYGGGFRCFGDRERFFSYRRDGQTGRLATMIWLD